ncbi:hypothetical protein [Streptomyces melanogenes]|uniref:Uncharacterized protein n=1 Tax=Streptomyces melanogenes TaxID=67326 RepID=A0ABZ1XWY8_9ACTN|nr:hypothetical protein [Streptomyces melanogenes]
MDDFPTRVLLTLRRFIGVPLPATDYSIHAAYQTNGNRYRVRLASPTSASINVDLPRHGADGEQIGTWWYVGALRQTARMASVGTLPFVRDDHGHRVVEAADLVAVGKLSVEGELTEQDALDYVIGDLTGDPLWHEAAASAAPDLYRLVGFDLRTRAVVRVYLLCDYGTIGVDLALYDADTGRARNVGWWAATKLIAILNPDDGETLAAHRVYVTTDPVCDAVYDLTNWA